jgi:hypothetical protein
MLAYHPKVLDIFAINLDSKGKLDLKRASLRSNRFFVLLVYFNVFSSFIFFENGDGLYKY